MKLILSIVVNETTYALTTLDILFEVGLRHEILHVHLVGALGKDNAAVLLLNLNVGEVLSRIRVDPSNLEKVLVSCFIRALVIILVVLSIQTYLSCIDIALVKVVEHLSSISPCFLVLNEIS